MLPRGVLGSPAAGEGGPGSRPLDPAHPRKNQVFQVTVAKATILRASTWWAHVSARPCPHGPRPQQGGRCRQRGELEAAEGQLSGGRSCAAGPGSAVCVQPRRASRSCPATVPEIPSLVWLWGGHCLLMVVGVSQAVV